MSTDGQPADWYRDRWIVCSPTAIEIHGYYFPWGTKRIPYSRIRSVSKVPVGVFTGGARIWGTANPRYWASLDPGRPRKTEGIVLDLGRAVRPFITPDDVDAVAAAIERGGGPAPTADTSGRVV